MGRYAKADKEQVLEVWRALPMNTPTLRRLSETASECGISATTARRILTAAGVLGRSGIATKGSDGASMSKLRAVAADSAERIIRAVSPIVRTPHQMGIALAGGLVLADVITNQRQDIHKLSTTVSQLSDAVADLLQPQLDESGNPLPMDEGVIHRAAATVSKLVDATVKLHEATRDAWGIRKDQGPKSYAEMLEELDRTPPPVGNPPHVLGRNLTETPSHASISTGSSGLASISTPEPIPASISAGNSGLAPISTPDQDLRSDTPEVGNPPEGSEELSRLVPCRGALDGV